MKKTISAFMAVTALFTMLLFGSSFAAAAAESYTTITVSAADIAASTTYKAVQKQLNVARDSATATNKYKIVVEAGSYELDDALHIYSNTYLYLQGVTFTLPADTDSNMISVGAASAGVTGYYYTNVTIYGGTWNANANSATMVKVCHAANVKITNAVFKNCKESHIMEVAGVNGLTVESCTFQDQTLNKSTEETRLTYEAIQLDILSSTHIAGGYVSEDLNNKNITITSCTFNNVPRGVGSHTAVLNNPMDTVTITNNTFTNIGSCAVQLMGCKNCTISSNTITGAPRGIAVYSYQLNGTYLATTLAKEGGTSTSTATTYQTPTAANIVISGNKITLSGTDPYASYEQVGIFAGGLVLDTAQQGAGDKLPAGDYYLTGVTIKDNTVASTGHGIRLSDVRSAQITGNTLTYSGSTSTKNYGISLRDNSVASTISSNSTTSYYRGIYLLSSTVTDIKSNTITSPSNNGISLEGATATNITSNTVKSAGNNGINIYDFSTVGSVKSNTVSSAGKNAVFLQDSEVTGNIESNTITSPANNGIYLYDSSSAEKIYKNSITSAGKYGIDVENSTVTRISTNTVKKSVNNGICVLNSATVGYINSNTVATAGKNAIFVQDAKVTNNIEGNTITSPSNNGIYLYDSASAEKIYKNSVTSAGKYGIGIEGSTVTRISTNTIEKSANNGINVIASAKVSYINSNTVNTAGKNAIFVQASKVANNISSNTIKSPKNNGIYIYNSGTAAKINKNTITSAGKYGIDVEKGTVTKIADNTVSKSKNIGITVLNSAKVQTISGNMVKNGSSRGISISALKCAMTVSGNTVKNCTGDFLIYLNPGTKKYTITLKENGVTGADSKKSTGIKVASGNATLKANSVSSCKVGILLSTSASGTVYNNTLSDNKSNKLTIGSKKYALLKTTTLSTAKKAKTSIKLQWKKVSGADGYIIYRSTSKDGTYKKIATVSASKKLYTNKSLKKGKKYYYKIVAYRQVGNYTIYSSESAVLTAKTKS